MSELITQRPGLTDFRWRLLATASALSLLALTVTEAKAEDGDRPTVWIELGGQLSRLQNGQEIYAPPFVSLTPPELTSPQAVERPPRYGLDETGSVLFKPEGSSWHFSASIRYGRASTNEKARHQSYPGPFYRYQFNPRNGHKLYFPVYPIAARFTDARVKQRENHTIVDFEAGEDVGLGLFGDHASSSLNVGVRFAQFQSKSHISLNEDPDWHFSPWFYTNFIGFKIQYADQPFHTFAGSFSADRSFRGIGPSVSWSSSALLARSSESSELTLDFGFDGAVLLGRQKAKTHHQTTAHYHPYGQLRYPSYPSYGRTNVPPTRLDIVYQHAADHTRSQSVIVPNVGAFAGLSMKYPNAKVSFGYKADFFFGAMDGGIDVRSTSDVGFHGPFATVSIGL